MVDDHRLQLRTLRKLFVHLANYEKLISENSPLKTQRNYVPTGTC